MNETSRYQRGYRLRLSWNVKNEGREIMKMERGHVIGDALLSPFRKQGSIILPVNHDYHLNSHVDIQPA